MQKPSESKKKKISVTDIIFYAVITILIIYALINKVPQFINSQKLKQVNIEDLRLTGMDNTTHFLKEQKGKLVLLVFWASWCNPCRQEIPVLNELYKKYSRQNKLEIFAINTGENINQIEKIKNEKNILYPIMIDHNGELSNKFKITSIPALVFIDKEGKIIKINFGYSFFLKNEVKSLINKK